VSRFSEIIPDIIIFNDFDRYLFLFGYLLIMLTIMTLFVIIYFSEFMDPPQRPMSILPFF
jgi:hypothetical protein